MKTSMRITVSTIGTAGDMRPLGLLAVALARRGHTVRVHAPSFYLSAFAAARTAGAELLPAAGYSDDASLNATLAEVRTLPDPAAQLLRFLRYFFLEQNEACWARSAEALAGCELLVCNIIDHVTQAVAEMRRVPWLSWATRPPNSAKDAAQVDALLRESDEALLAYLRAHGDPRPRVPLFRAESPLGNLIAAGPELATLPSDAYRTFLTGTWLGPLEEQAPLPQPIEDFFRAGPPPLLLTFGAPLELARPFLPMWIEAVTRTGQRALLQSAPERAASEEVPEFLDEKGRCLRVGRLSYAAVLPRVRAVVHHGGAGTTAEVCCAGKPQLLVPFNTDQYYWADRVQTLGLGPAFIPHVELRTATLRAGILALTNERYGEAAAYATRAKELGQRLKRDDGIAEAVRLIEALGQR